MPVSGYASGDLACHSNDGIDELLVKLNVTLILREISLAVRLVEHAPLFCRQFNSVLQIAAFGTISTAAQRG